VRHLADSVRSRFAVLARNKVGEIPAISVNQLTQAKHYVGALGKRGSPPGWKGLPSDCYGVIDLLGASERDSSLNVPGCNPRLDRIVRSATEPAGLQSNELLSLGHCFAPQLTWHSSLFYLV
jgi:hypothetical protein